MQHKRRLVVFVIFVLCMFFLMTFANGSKNAKIATRVVEFIDGFDNSVISSQTIEVGTDAEVPKDPTHKNYVFAGWYLYDDRDVKVTNFNNIMEDLKVIALYKGDINNNGIADENDEYYTVKFVDSLNNNVISSQTVLVGMDATAPAVPSHKGYTFTGWNRGYTDVESDITVKALYRKNAVVKYTVTFIDGDTNQKISVQEVEKGATATLPETPKHENRVFVRWDGKYTNITKDVTITAIYADDKNNDGIVDEEQAHYTITYVDYDGEVLGEFKEVLVNTETPKLENEPTRNNYKFNGWDPTVATTVTGNATYTATYEPINDKNNNGKADEEEAHYTIKYVDYDGKTLGEFKEVLVNTTTPTVSEPTRDNYKFTGWNPTVATTVTGNATYTATYEPINDENGNGKADEEEEHYTITYVDYDGEEIKTFTNVLVDTETPTVTEPTRDNYKFTGWNPSVAATVTGNATYTATYEPINDKNNNGKADEEETHYTIKYVDYDGKTLGEFKEVLVNTTTPTVSEPTRDNYKFTGWNPTVATTVTGNATYTATYEPINDENGNGKADEEEAHYTIKYVDYDGEVLGEFKAVLVDTETPTVTEPTRDNYKFTGWNPTVATTVTGNATYTATYEPINDKNNNGIADEEEAHYTIKYVDYDGKTLGEFKAVLVNTATPTITNPTREYYTFDKWTPSVATTVTENATYTATYKPINDINNNGIADEEEEHYTIIYLDYDGKALGTFTNVLVNTATPTVAEPTREYYTFDKWTPSVAATVTETATYTATYKPINDKNNNGKADEEEAHYTIIYLDYDGKALGTFTNVLVNTATPTVSEPTREYYRFTGWNPSVETTVTETATYTATYEPINDKNNNGKADEEEAHYTITYVDYDGEVLGEFKEVLVNTETPKLENEPTRNNYKFNGWDPTVATTVTGNATYTATYEPINDKNNNGKADEEEAHYTIKYVDYDGKTLGEFKEVLVNTTTPTVSEPTRDNYKFTGWNPTVATTVTGNATYTATYKPINDKNNNGKADEEEAHYTIKYVDYDGKTLGEFKEVLVNTATPTITNPTREYYTFDKWTPSVAATVTGNATYTATYEPINDKNNNGKADEEEAHYTITYVDYNGEEIKTFTNVLVNTATPTITNPTREYYTFEGWNPSVATTVTKSATYKATYKPINDKNNDGIADEEQTLWEVKFYGFDGTTQLGDVQYVIDGEDAKAPQAPTVKGYTFTKWDKEFTNVKSNLDVKAIYVDTEAPVIDAKVVLYNEKDGSYQNANITATVTDNDSVAEVRYLLGEHQLADYDKATVMNKSADGTYQINGLTKNSVYTIFAKDATGNISVKYVEVEGITVLEGDFEDLYAKGTFGELTGFPVIGTYRKNLSIVTKSDVKIVDARVYYGSSYKTVADFEKNPNLGTAIKHDDTKLSYQIEGSFLERVTIYVKYAEEVEVAPGVTETKYVSKVYTTRLTYWFNDAK